MANPTLTNTPTVMTACDLFTDWTMNSGGTDADILKEGSASITGTLRTAGNNDAYYTRPTGTWDISNTHLRLWFNYAFPSYLNTTAGGGIQILVYDGTNTGYWYQDADNYEGGWVNFVQNTAASFNSGSCNLTAVTRVGIRLNLTGSPRNIDNCWIDNICYGDGYTITGGTSGDKVTWNTLAATDASLAEGWGIVQQINGVFFVNGKLTFGDTGTSSIYFEDTSEVVTFISAPVATSLYEIIVTGNSTGTTSFIQGSVTGSGSSAVGSEGVLVKSATTSLPFGFTAANTNIDELKLYGSSLVNPSTVNLGSTSTVLGGSGSTVHLVDNNFTNPTQVVKNISSSATTNILRNTVVSANSTSASMNLYDTLDVTSSEWSIIEGSGYESTATATTIDVTGEAFPNTSTNKPYLTIQDSASAVWNLNNVSDGAGGRITVGANQDEFAFAGNSNGSVNENFTVTWKVEKPDGTDLNLARVKIIETAPAVAIANEGSTNATGDASSTYLRANYVPSGATTITATTHTPAAYKVYKYTYLPYVASATINSAATVNVALLDDPYYITGSAATAITNGESGTAISIIEASTNEHSLIKFTGGSGGTLSDNDTITGSGSTADGQLVGKIIEGDNAAGTILLDNRDANSFTNGDTLSNGGGWTATYTNSSEQRFHFIIDAGLAQSRTAQNVYDYIMAKLDEATADTSPPIDDLIIAGRAEFGTPLQGVSVSPNKFQTVDNDALNQGWAIANLSDLSAISQFTDNTGAAFTPQTTVNLTVTVVDKVDNGPIPLAQVAIYRSSDKVELMNEDTETVTTGSFVVGVKYRIVNVGDTDFTLIGASSNAVGVVFTATGSGGGTTGTATNGIATQSFIYTSDTSIYARVRKSSSGATKYIPFSTTGTITSTGFTTTITLQEDTNA